MRQGLVRVLRVLQCTLVSFEPGRQEARRLFSRCVRAEGRHGGPLPLEQVRNRNEASWEAGDTRGLGL